MDTQINFVTEEGYSANIVPDMDCIGDVSWNGYIRIPKGHPLFGKKLEEMEENFEIDVHGGLSYARQEGEMWTFGFWTCHFSDGIFGKKNCKGPDYVKNECEKLCRD